MADTSKWNGEISVAKKSGGRNARKTYHVKLQQGSLTFFVRARKSSPTT